MLTKAHSFELFELILTIYPKVPDCLIDREKRTCLDTDKIINLLIMHNVMDKQTFLILRKYIHIQCHEYPYINIALLCNRMTNQTYVQLKLRSEHNIYLMPILFHLCIHMYERNNIKTELESCEWEM